MPPALLQTLRNSHPWLRARWEQKLRAVPPSSPLADPDALAYLMDGTLRDLFRALAGSPAHPSSHSRLTTDCPCGRNPLTTYFITAEETLLEFLFGEGRSGLSTDFSERENEIAWVRGALQQVAAREISAFCAVCRYRPRSAETRHLEVVG